MAWIAEWLSGWGLSSPPPSWFLDPRFRLSRLVPVYHVISKHDQRVYSARRTFRVLQSRDMKVYSPLRTFKIIHRPTGA
jgi:hypothetical protein